MEKTGDFLQKIENFVDLYDCQTVAFVVLSAALVIEIIHFDFFLHLFKVIRSELPSSLNLEGRYKSVSHATLNKEFALTKR